MSRVTGLFCIIELSYETACEAGSRERGAACSWSSFLTFPSISFPMSEMGQVTPGVSSSLLQFYPVSHGICLKILCTQQVGDKGCFWGVYFIAPELALSIVHTSTIISWIWAPVLLLVCLNEMGSRRTSQSFCENYRRSYMGKHLVEILCLSLPWPGYNFSRKWNIIKTLLGTTPYLR